MNRTIKLPDLLQKTDCLQDLQAWPTPWTFVSGETAEEFQFVPNEVIFGKFVLDLLQNLIPRLFVCFPIQQL